MARAQIGNSHKRKQQRCKILQYSRIFNHYTTATNTTNASSVIEEATERVDELDQDLKLIRTIKQFKILYSTDKLHKQYKPNILNQKDKAWTIVANAIGMSGKYNFCFSKFFIFTFVKARGKLYFVK